MDLRGDQEKQACSKVRIAASPSRSVLGTTLCGDIDDVVCDDPVKHALAVTDALCGQTSGNSCHEYVDDLVEVLPEKAYLRVPNVAFPAVKLMGTSNDDIGAISEPPMRPTMQAGSYMGKALRGAAFPTEDLVDEAPGYDAKFSKDKQATSKVSAAAFPADQEKQAVSKVPIPAFPTVELGGEEKQAATNIRQEKYASSKLPIATFPARELGVDTCSNITWRKWAILKLVCVCLCLSVSVCVCLSVCLSLSVSVCRSV